MSGERDVVQSEAAQREAAAHDTQFSASSLAQRLDAARRKRFAGRAHELARFASALAAADSPFAVLHVYGPGGIGKTTLLHELGRIAQQAGRQVIYMDARDVDASPAGILTGLGLALDIPPAQMSAARLGDRANLVLLIDTYEALEGMDSWLRNVLLPNLGERSLAILAGRNAPAPAWRTDLAWGELTATLPLRKMRGGACHAVDIPAGISQAPAIRVRLPGGTHYPLPFRKGEPNMSVHSAEMTLAHRYFDAWNAHDAAAIVETFAPGGVYHDPTCGGALRGQAIGEYAAGLWSAFPDLQFELESTGMMGEGCLAAQWITRGTNAGSMLGLPPTGRSVELAGADFIALDAAGIRSVTGYFDSAEMPRQLGLQTVVQPHQLGPFTFGVSNCVQSGNTATPQGLVFTCLVARDEEEKATVSAYGRQISQEMLGMPGFISSIAMGLGSRMLTVSTWESDEHPQQLMRGGTHREATRHFYSDGHYLGGFTSVWKPIRFSFSARCPQCGRMHRDSRPIEQCACGATLHTAPNLW